MPKMKLFLVRHGETKENVAGILMGHHHGVLTEKGKAQAKETAMVLKDYKFAHIYSSDLNRCIDTAEFIKEFHPDTPLTFTKELRELNMGAFQGQMTSSVDWDSLFSDEVNGKAEGGESLSELKTRALDFVRQLYERHTSENILLVTHGGWIAQVISHFARVPSRDIFGKIGNAQVFEVEVGKDLTGKVLNLNQ